MPGFAIQLARFFLRRLSCALIFLFVVGALAAPAATPSGQLPRTQKHEGHHLIDQLEESWRKAVLNGDAATMSGLLADDFIAITANGTLLTKEQTLAKLSSGHTHYTSLELSDIRVRFYGSTALVTSLARVTGANAERDITGNFRYTRVYVRNAQGAWKIVSFEASRIRVPGEHK
jgi:ketosteroid isomerase-like protein